MKSASVLLGFLLIVCMSFAMGGSGTPGDPYTISDCTDLQNMSSALSASYALANDVTCTGTFTPVGTSGTPFTGTFNGGFHNISGLNVSHTGGPYSGLFGYVNGAAIGNVTFQGSSVRGASYTGTLVGYGTGTSISNVTVYGNVSTAATYHISQLMGGSWQEIGTHSFGVHYETASFPVSKSGDSVTLSLVQRDADFGDVEQAKLTCGGATLVPQYAVYTGSSRSVLDDILYNDSNVAVAHDNPIEVSWDVSSCSGPLTFYLTANEYGTDLPFRFPNYEEYAAYRMGANSGSINVDGVLDASDALPDYSYAPFWAPSTGHPNGYTYVYVKDDAQNVYVALDITMDNSDDADKDWAEVSVLTDSGVKKFRINDTDSTWGFCGFGTTGKVSYRHAMCEFKIPKSEIGNPVGLKFTLGYYGTGASTYYVGGLAGYLEGSSNVTGCGFTGNVSTNYVQFVAGLVGVVSTSTINNSYADVNLTNGYGLVGGLVGQASGSSVIENSHSSGNITSSGGSVGGLVGSAYGANISRSYSTANAASSGGGSVGGLVGDFPSSGSAHSINNSYATGNATASGGTYCGGLVGHMAYNETIANSYASGSASCTNWAGGLVGFIDDGGLFTPMYITNSFATGSVSSGGTAGGLFAFGPSILSASNSYWDMYRTGQSASNGTGNLSGTTGVNSGNSQPTYFYQASNAPLLSWDFVNIWHEHAGDYPDFTAGAPPASVNITDCSGLQNMNSGLSLTYLLANDIDCTGVAFTPVGTFTGTLDGQGHRITGLNVTVASSNVGLFSTTDHASIHDLTLDGVLVGGTYDAAALVGSGTSTSIWNVHAAGQVTNLSSSSGNLGGLAAELHYSTVTNSSFTGTVSSPGAGTLGCLVAYAEQCNISNSNASCNLTASGTAGGLVGYDPGSNITGCHAAGSVTCSGNNCGGLVGMMSGASTIVTNSSAAASTAVGGFGGGLVGTALGGTINTSYATGSITCTGIYCAGLLGQANPCGIANSYATASVNCSDDYCAGLVGLLLGTSSINNSYAAGSVTENNPAGYGGGLVGRFFGSAGTSISNSFAAGQVTGVNVSGFIGTNTSAFTAVNSYWDVCRSGQNLCTVDGNITGCTGVNDGCGGYFYLASNSPLSSWDFSGVWHEHAGAYPDFIAGSSAPLSIGFTDPTPANGSTIIYQNAVINVTATGNVSQCTLNVNTNASLWANVKHLGIYGGRFNYNASVGVNKSSSFTMQHRLPFDGGVAHTCYLLSDGNSACYGDTTCGGNSPCTGSSGQSTNYTGGDAIGVSAGYYHTCYVLADGNSVCYGYNASGTGQATGYGGGDAVAVSAAYGHTCYLRSNGNSVCYGDPGSLSTTYGGGDAVALSASEDYSCYLRSNGTGVCYNNVIPPYTAGDAIGVAAGTDYVCYLLSSGNSACYGDNDHGRATNYTGGGAIAIASGGWHTCYLLSSGNSACHGYDTYGQSTNYSGGDAIAVTTGQEFTCYLRSNGSVVCYGNNIYGQSANYTSGGLKMPFAEVNASYAMAVHNADGNTTASYTLPTMAYITHVLYANCTSSANSSNVSERRAFTLAVPLAMSNVSRVYGYESATITWNSNQDANATVNYGTTAALGTYATNSTAAEFHSVPLAGLNASASYYYNVTSCTAWSDCVTLGSFNFTTNGVPPIVAYAPPTPANGSTVTYQNAAINATVSENATSCTLTVSRGLWTNVRHLNISGGAFDYNASMGVNNYSSFAMQHRLPVLSGNTNTCYLRSDGNSVCYGDNGSGQSTGYAGGDAVSMLATSTGAPFTCYVLSSGNSVCYGNNGSGQSTGYTGGNAIAGGGGNAHACYLLSTGNSVCYGNNGSGQATGYTGGNAIEIGVSLFHTCYLLSTGNSVCYGSNSSGRSTGYTGGNAIAIAAGQGHTCYVLSSGNSVCYGNNGSGQSTGYTGGNAIAVSSGYDSTCYLLSGGNSVCYGSNDSGQAIAYTGGNAIALSAGQYHVCYLLSSGNTFCYGSNDSGRSTGYTAGDLKIPFTATNASFFSASYPMTVHNAGGNTAADYTLPALPDGKYALSTNCTGFTNNSNVSETRVFTLAMPLISNVSVSYNDTDATVMWSTTEDANSTVNYGTAAALGTYSVNSTAVQFHNITLGGLTPAMLYYFNITSCTAGGMCNTSGPYNFTTLMSLNCPVISSAGTYTMFQNSIGSPNSASEVQAGTTACVKIAASDVVFDCNGFNITNDGPQTSRFGIVVNGSRTNVTVRNCNIQAYARGIYTYYTPMAITNVSASGNSVGFYVASNGTNVSGSSAFGNNNYGFYVLRAWHTRLSGNDVSGNLRGILLLDGGNSTLAGNAVHGNTNGTTVTSLATLSEEHYYGNTMDLVVQNGSTTYNLNLTTVVFDSPAGAYQNFTNLSLMDISAGNAGYAISWASNPSALPHGYVSFAGKFVNISNTTTGISIESLVFSWTDAEVSAGGYNETRFGLWEFHNGLWIARNLTPDTTANRLSTFIGVVSVFGILQLNDTAGPSVALDSPANLTATNVSTVEFNFTATDDVSDTLNCSLYLDGVLNRTNEMTDNGTRTNFTVPGMRDGLHAWYVTCIDGSYNAGTSETRNVTVDTVAPAVALVSPANNTTDTLAQPITFTFTAVDNASSALACTFYLDGTANQDTSAANDTPTEVAVRRMASGLHNWSMACTDAAGNAAGSETWEFLAGTPPALPSSSSSRGVAPPEALSVSVAPSCGGYVVSVRKEDGSAADALIDASYNGTHAVTYSNASGQAFFSGCGMDVSVWAAKSGAEGDASAFIECLLCGGCMADSDCGDAQACVAGSCVARTTLPANVSTNQTNQTVPVQPTNETQPQNGTQQPPACTPGSCGAGAYCDAGTCIPNPVISAPSTAVVGQNVTLTIGSASDPCKACEFTWVSPSGAIFHGMTDANGKFTLPVSETGTYVVTLTKSGTQIRISATPAAAPPQGGAPEAESTGQQPQQSNLPLLLLVAGVVVLAVVAGAAYLLRPPKPGKRG